LKTPGQEASEPFRRDKVVIDDPAAQLPDDSNPAMPGHLAASLDAPDAVEAALAKALGEAAAAGRFDVVGQLARELEARRLARATSKAWTATGRVASRGASGAS
jgi:hypothetical protein